ncbi:MAG: phytanoyl-CoA dioxygenase family protein [Bacteroidetes bacterium]|nr:phytanoyl-CoA dioxygenase family protein [Bacteroidota bacterium]
MKSINCTFLSTFYNHHRRIKSGNPPLAAKDFSTIEDIWMSFFGLGKFETYQFIYNSCTSIEDLEQWIIRLKGETQAHASAAAFDQWTQGNTITHRPGQSILTEPQWQAWNNHGYIKVSNLIDDHFCDSVSELICNHLNVDLTKKETWYNNHPDWHGLMLQLYQHESINKIKTLPCIRHLFTELYDTPNITPNTEKVSFNPPETATWKFRHHQLHWDIDFANPDLQYIQGLIYLNDVPEPRGPLTLVPGFHHQFEDWIKTYPNPDQAQKVMQNTLAGTPIPGKKGDLILWLQTLPHAASANHSDLPRFVQYISFSKC